MLPLNENKSSLVWTVSRDMAKDMVNMDEEMFVLNLNKALISEENESAMVNSISEGFGLFLNTFLPQKGPNTMLPPTVKGKRKLGMPLCLIQREGLGMWCMRMRMQGVVSMEWRDCSWGGV